MEFGKLNDIAQLDLMSWDLPPADPKSVDYLSSLKSKNAEESYKVWMGAPAWGHKEWIGKIYPPKTKAADFLFHYSRYYNTIELNTTHYRIPSVEQVQKWCAAVPGDFKFCPKIVNSISHDARGLIDPELHQAWYDSIREFGSSLGPCFLQLPPHFDYQQKALLFQFLKLWPDEFPLALEFRHPSWFQDQHVLPALAEYLQSRKIGMVITDVAGRRDVLHSTVTAPFTMIRFIGNDLHATDYKRADIWNTQLNEWKKQGLQEVFFFVHQPDDVLAPDMSEYLRGLDHFAELRSRKSIVEESQISFGEE